MGTAACNENLCPKPPMASAEHATRQVNGGKKEEKKEKKSKIDCLKVPRLKVEQTGTGSFA